MYHDCIAHSCELIGALTLFHVPIYMFKVLWFGIESYRLRVRSEIRIILAVQSLHEVIMICRSGRYSPVSILEFRVVKAVRAALKFM
jgi:hypothetical protein